MNEEILRERIRMTFSTHGVARYRNHTVTRRRKRVYLRGERVDFLYYVDQRPTPFDHIDLALDEIDYLVDKEQGR